MRGLLVLMLAMIVSIWIGTSCEETEASTVSPATTVVQYGDTYWALAKYLCPDSDTGVVAGRLLERNGNRLIAGQTINTKGIC